MENVWKLHTRGVTLYVCKKIEFVILGFNSIEYFFVKTQSIFIYYNPFANILLFFNIKKEKVVFS